MKLETINIKGRPYVMVKERVKAFWEIYPDGQIRTEILKLTDDMVVMKATAFDQNEILATGHAFEMRESSNINLTSYIENCETSAVGRALAFLGIGIDTSIASADEKELAIAQQEALKKEEISKQKIDALKATALRKRCEEAGIDPAKVAELYSVDRIEDLTEAKHSNLCAHWAEVIERCKA